MNDKLKHFIAGFLLSSLGVVYAPLFYLGFIAGLGKEVYDQINHKPFDAWDLIATWAGAAVAVMAW